MRPIALSQFYLGHDMQRTAADRVARESEGE